MTLTLRRALATDAAALALHMSDEAVFGNVLQLPHPSEELWRQRIQDNNAAGSTHLMLVAERDDELVGCAGLHPVGPALRRRHAMTLGISVSPHAQGQGIGRALMEALIDYADRWGQVLRIELTVYADNERAIRLYERCGFEREGRLRGYALRDGRYEDCLTMARLHPQPPRWSMP
ncbi:GNAT family N-acetyltransferase [Pelomonas sp. KK5]|uniref:GNAT family N-acetyltransferase n=1 Tax=Pelomonas sp. KK5 TaxID=1855730 RepID=UPI00097C4CEC|nr:GNAT family N-acetyltransferase [Pelomonas sp. KK5]